MYRSECEIGIGESFLMFNVHPVLSVMPPAAKLEDELRRIIEKGPFLETKLKPNCREEKKVKIKAEEVK